MAIYIGTQKIDVSGVDKVYVGTQLVYQKAPQPQWHTEWEGNRRVGYGGTTATTTFATIPYVEGLKIRVTFNSMTAQTPSDYGSHTYSYIPSDKVSPYTKETFTTGYNQILRVYARNNSQYRYAEALVRYNRNDGVIESYYTSQDSGVARAWMNVTKIEAYY